MFFRKRARATTEPQMTAAMIIYQTAAERIVVLNHTHPVAEAVEFMVFEHMVTHPTAGTFSTEVVVHVSNAAAYHSATREVITKVIWRTANDYDMVGTNKVTTRVLNIDRSLYSITLVGGEFDGWMIMQADSIPHIGPYNMVTGEPWI